MNIHRILPRARAALGLVLCAASAPAAEISGQDKALAIEAARADLYAQLVRQIKGIQVAENTIVANMVTEESTRSAAMDGFIRGVQVGEPQFSGDVCIIPGSITLQQVVENVNSLTRTNGGASVAYEKVERLNSLRVVRAHGVGSVRARLEEAPAAGGESDTGLAEAIAKLQGPGQLKLGAIEAARIDALAQLARQVKGVRVTDSAAVYNMATDNRWTDTQTEALVKGASVLRYAAVDGELAACTMQITLQQLVENIESTRTTTTLGGLTVSDQLAERIRRYNPALTKITATGYGAVRSAAAAQAPTEFVGSVK